MAENGEAIPLFVSGESPFAQQLRETLAARSDLQLVTLAGPDAHFGCTPHTPRIGLIEFDTEAARRTGQQSVAVLARAFPEAGLILFGRLRDAANIAQTLARGGAHILEYLSLPALDTPAEIEAYISERVLPHIREVAAALPANGFPVREAESISGSALPLPANRDRSRISDRFDLCAIGVSAGGPRALDRLLRLLPAQLNGGILIAQHMPAGFTEQLARSLNEHSPLEVIEARDGVRVERGKVYLAPGGHHTTVRRRGDRVELQVAPGPPHNHCQPSIDLLLESLAEVIPTRTLAILMTGMGTDGKDGLGKLKAAGAYSLAQNEASCTIFGIPARAIEAGLIDEVLSIEELAKRVIAGLGVYDQTARADART